MRISIAFRAAMCALLLAAPVAAEAQLSQDFEDIGLLSGQGWFIKNNSAPLGENSWFQGNGAVFPAFNGAPDAYLGANFNSASGAGDISNWLITPMLSLTNGSVFSFFARSVNNLDFPDRLELRMSTAGASTDVGTSALSVGDFNTLLLSINPTLASGGFPDEWTQYSATISGLASEVMGRFALRYFVTDGGPEGSASDYIGVDAVRYEAAAVPEPASLALVTLGLLAVGVSHARRRRHVVAPRR